MAVEIIHYKEKQRWESVLEMFKQKDAYYFHGYCYLYNLVGDGDPHLFFYEEKNGSKICYPFIKREINFQFCTEEKMYDIITPYGYGGPLTENVNQKAVNQFRRKFNEYCQRENIISEFIRFHPLLNNHQYLEDAMDVVYDRETIYIDLMKSETELFESYHKNHQRNIKKAIKNKLEFKVFEKENALSLSGDFYNLYSKTMDKLQAAQYYYFSIEYIRELLERLHKHSVIGAVFYEGKLISAALCLYEGEHLHYHLGCSDKEYLHLGANMFQFHQISLWGKDKGLRNFHLGGGHIGRDSLFQFKQRFNKEGNLRFYIGRKIHNVEKYDQMVASWETYHSEKLTTQFFPAYRLKSPVKI